MQCGDAAVHVTAGMHTQVPDNQYDKTIVKVCQVQYIEDVVDVPVPQISEETGKDEAGPSGTSPVIVEDEKHVLQRSTSEKI